MPTVVNLSAESLALLDRVAKRGRCSRDGVVETAPGRFDVELDKDVADALLRIDLDADRAVSVMFQSHAHGGH